MTGFYTHRRATADRQGRFGSSGDPGQPCSVQVNVLLLRLCCYQLLVHVIRSLDSSRSYVSIQNAQTWNSELITLQAKGKSVIHKPNKAGLKSCETRHSGPGFMNAFVCQRFGSQREACGKILCLSQSLHQVANKTVAIFPTQTPLWLTFPKSWSKLVNQGTAVYVINKISTHLSSSYFQTASFNSFYTGNTCKQKITDPLYNWKFLCCPIFLQFPLKWLLD